MRTFSTICTPYREPQRVYAVSLRAWAALSWSRYASGVRALLPRARWHACFDDPTFPYDMIRREHSPPASDVAATLCRRG